MDKYELSRHLLLADGSIKVGGGLQGIHEVGKQLQILFFVHFILQLLVAAAEDGCKFLAELLYFGYGVVVGR